MREENGKEVGGCFVVSSVIRGAQDSPCDILQKTPINDQKNMKIGEEGCVCLLQPSQSMSIEGRCTSAHGGLGRTAASRLLVDFLTATSYRGPLGGGKLCPGSLVAVIRIVWE